MRLASWFALALTLALVACSNDPEALYGDGEGTAGGGAVGLDDLILPATPDEARKDACTACAAKTCGAERSACLDDDDCIDSLRCKSDCKHPSCLADCEAEVGFSVWYDDLWACVFDRCSTDCGTGENWDCAGNYDWTRQVEPRVRVRHEFVSIVNAGGERMATFAAGARGRFCGYINPSGCEPLIDEAIVDSSNALTLDVAPVEGNALDPYLRLETPELGPWGMRHRLYGPPIARPTTTRAVLISRELLTALLGSWLDSELAYLVVGAGDCLRAPPVGARFSLEGLEEKLRQCDPSCDPGARQVYFAIAELTPEDVEPPLRIRLLRSDGEELLAERAFHAQAGWLTQVWLDPLTRGR